MFLVEPRNKKTPEAPPEDNAVETDELDANVQQLEAVPLGRSPKSLKDIAESHDTEESIEEERTTDSTLRAITDLIDSEDFEESGLRDSVDDCTVATLDTREIEAIAAIDIVPSASTVRVQNVPKNPTFARKSTLPIKPTTPKTSVRRSASHNPSNTYGTINETDGSYWPSFDTSYLVKDNDVGVTATSGSSEGETEEKYTDKPGDQNQGSDSNNSENPNKGSEKEDAYSSEEKEANTLKSPMNLSRSTTKEGEKQTETQEKAVNVRKPIKSLLKASSFFQRMRRGKSFTRTKKVVINIEGNIDHEIDEKKMIVPPLKSLADEYDSKSDSTTSAKDRYEVVPTIRDANIYEDFKNLNDSVSLSEETDLTEDLYDQCVTLNHSLDNSTVASAVSDAPEKKYAPRLSQRMKKSDPESDEESINDAGYFCGWFDDSEGEKQLCGKDQTPKEEEKMVRSSSSKSSRRKYVAEMLESIDDDEIRYYQKKQLIREKRRIEKQLQLFDKNKTTTGSGSLSSGTLSSSTYEKSDEESYHRSFDDSYDDYDDPYEKLYDDSHRVKDKEESTDRFQKDVAL